jgi:glycine cleavage system H protein
MNIPKELKYAESHEWIKVDGDVAIIGVSDYAQSELGDIVFVEMPEVGDDAAKDESCGTIEAVSGEIVEINEALEDEPTLVNSDCYGDGWIIKIKMSDASELDDLMDADAYEEFVG